MTNYFNKMLGKRGTAFYYTNETWVTDTNMPILKENWDYINKYIYVGDN